jgi:hypothetical protein
MRRLVFLLVFLSLVLCGCNYRLAQQPAGNATVASPEAAIRGLPEVRAILSQNADAVMTIRFVDSLSFAQDRAEVEKACKRTMPQQGYFKATIASAGFNGTMWVSEYGYDILCGIRNVVVTVLANASAAPTAQPMASPSIAAADACSPECNPACQFCGAGKCLYKAGMDCCSDSDCAAGKHCAGNACSTPTPSPSPTPSLEPSPTPSPSESPSPSPSPTPSLEPSPSPSPTPDDSWRPHYG